MKGQTQKTREENFIPCTVPRHIGEGFYFRPIRSWHSNTYAGEKLISHYGDGSGCMRSEKFNRQQVCPIPYTVTHRLYWHKSDPKKTISAFLSYPDGMGCSDGEYFWEALGVSKDDVTRYFGPKAEAKMEAAIIRRMKKDRAQSEAR